MTFKRPWRSRYVWNFDFCWKFSSSTQWRNIWVDWAGFVQASNIVTPFTKEGREPRGPEPFSFQKKTEEHNVAWSRLRCITTNLGLPSLKTSANVYTIRLCNYLSVRHTVNTVFFNKHCCSSFLMLRPHHLKQSSFIYTHCSQFH